MPLSGQIYRQSTSWSWVHRVKRWNSRITSVLCKRWWPRTYLSSAEINRRAKLTENRSVSQICFPRTRNGWELYGEKPESTKSLYDSWSLEGEALRCSALCWLWLCIHHRMPVITMSVAVFAGTVALAFSKMEPRIFPRGNGLCCRVNCICWCQYTRSVIVLLVRFLFSSTSSQCAEARHVL